jgi:asparagine synthase (glutamine-hydrolysing)
MSGFAAVWNTDGARVDGALLMRMQNFLSSRGPDEQRLAILGPQKNVGLVHAAFHTTPESNREQQPCTIDGVVWLTGHIRIDAREHLSKLLRAHNLSRGTATDAQMVLQAYRVWGRSFVDHIIGDYSFVIWDEREQRLFAVRDHLGTRPLFYARAGQTWIVSNTLDCVRLHAGVRGELDDVWISNFLARVRRADFERTAYNDIKRLGPGHVLDLTPAGGGVRKYWQLEVGEPTFYKRREEYLEHFRDLAKTTIRDRIRIGRVGIGMSGGLDSTSIVALLLQLVEDKTNDIVVNSTYSEKLIYDDERRYAAAAADHFGISIKFQNLDSTFYDPQWWTRSSIPPEPSEGVLSQFVAMDRTQPDEFSNIRILLVGQGPDEALHYGDWKPYLKWLFKTGRFIKFSSALYSRLSVARPLAKILSSLRVAFHSNEILPVLEKPAWLRDDVLDSRTFSNGLHQFSDKHPWRPIAVGSFCSPVWQDYFDSYDPGFAWRLIEAAHPYLDVRMLQFLLSIPVVPWCHRKLLVRESMRGLLPELVLTRKKTTLSDDPWIKAMVGHPFPPISKTLELSRYVDMSKIPTGWAADVQQNRMIRRLLALQYWLQQRNAHPHRQFLAAQSGRDILVELRAHPGQTAGADASGGGPRGALGR